MNASISADVWSNPAVSHELDDRVPLSRTQTPECRGKLRQQFHERIHGYNQVDHIQHESLELTDIRCQQDPSQLSDNNDCSVGCHCHLSISISLLSTQRTQPFAIFYFFESVRKRDWRRYYPSTVNRISQHGLVYALALFDSAWKTLPSKFLSAVIGFVRD